MQDSNDIYTADFADILVFTNNGTWCYREEVNDWNSLPEFELLEFASVGWITFMMEVHFERKGKS